VNRELLRALTAEAIGTFALVFAGCGAIRVYLTAPVLGASLGALAYQFVRGEQTRPAQLSEVDGSEEALG